MDSARFRPPVSTASVAENAHSWTSCVKSQRPRRWSAVHITQVYRPWRPMYMSCGQRTTQTGASTANVGEGTAAVHGQRTSMCDNKLLLIKLSGDSSITVMQIGFILQTTLSLFYRKHRHIAYGNVVALAWGWLGRANRVPLPACVMRMIREAFPSDIYTGYKESGQDS